MAASLEGNPEAGPSKCEVCLGEPHPVEDCLLVNRLATGDEEKLWTTEETQEKADWQQVKLPKEEARQQRCAGKNKGRGQAGRVITVRRGSPVHG